MSVWYLYIVRTRKNSLYTGIATDVERRLDEHQHNKGARYLRGKGPLLLVLSQRIGDRGTALKLESQVKKLSKIKKEQLIKKYTLSTEDFFLVSPETGVLEINI